MLQSSNVSSSCFSKLLSSFTYFYSIITFLRRNALSSHRTSTSLQLLTDRSDGTVRIIPLADEDGGRYLWTDQVISSMSSDPGRAMWNKSLSLDPSKPPTTYITLLKMTALWKVRCQGIWPLDSISDHFLVSISQLQRSLNLYWLVSTPPNMKIVFFNATAQCRYLGLGRTPLSLLISNQSFDGKLY